MWRPVVGWESWYEVSATGQVRTCERHAPCVTPQGIHTTRLLKHIVLAQSTNRRGHKRVMLRVDGRPKYHAYVHTLVAAAFIGPRPEGLLVCHRNDQKPDNAATNLYYGTRKDNAQDALRNGCHGTERRRLTP